MSYDPNQKKLFKLDLFRTLKRNYSLVPLIGLISFGVVIASASIIRTMIRSPDVVINRKRNPKPYEEWEKKRYRYFATQTNPIDTDIDNERPRL